MRESSDRGVVRSMGRPTRRQAGDYKSATRIDRSCHGGNGRSYELCGSPPEQDDVMIFEQKVRLVSPFAAAEVLVSVLRH